jgi:hypothetical protein
LICAFGALVGGCARGVAEYQLYVQAFNLQYAQGDAILDSVARAERIVALSRMGRSVTVRSFNPDEAAYLVESVDPPITGSIRASYRALRSYNEALGALANGEAATALTNRLGTLTSNIVGAIAATGLAGTGAGALGAGSLVSEANSALRLAAPIVQQVATFAGREVFRRQLIEAYPHMRNLLLAMRKGTPVMFDMLEVSRITPGTRTRTGLTPASQAELERDRVQLAGWVVLMDKTLVTMDAAVAAAASDDLDGGLVGVADASVELRVLAEKIKSLRAK